MSPTSYVFFMAVWVLWMVQMYRLERRLKRHRALDLHLVHLLEEYLSTKRIAQVVRVTNLNQHTEN